MYDPYAAPLRAAYGRLAPSDCGVQRGFVFEPNTPETPEM
jgi:hypothetical protein